MASVADKLDAIYCIVHQVYEVDRVHRVIDHLLHRMPSYPRERIKICAPTWGSTLTNEDCMMVYDPWQRRQGWPSFTWKNRCMIKGEISLILNFYAAMKNALKEGHKIVIVLESDVVLRPDFESRLLKLFECLESDNTWDYVSLSDGIGSHTDEYTGPYMEQKVCKPPHTFPFRCTDSMLFQTRIFEKICQTLIPFRDCLDWEMNFQFLVHGGKALWAEPHLVEQGTTKNRAITYLPA